MKSPRRAERVQILSLRPHAAHISPHVPAPPSCFLQPISARPSPPRPRPPQHASGYAAQLQRISCSLSRPGGLSLQRGRKSLAEAKVRWRKKSSRTSIVLRMRCPCAACLTASHERMRLCVRIYFRIQDKLLVDDCVRVPLRMRACQKERQFRHWKLFCVGNTHLGLMVKASKINPCWSPCPHLSPFSIWFVLSSHLNSFLPPHAACR